MRLSCAASNKVQSYTINQFQIQYPHTTVPTLLADFIIHPCFFILGLDEGITPVYNVKPWFPVNVPLLYISQRQSTSPHSW